MLNIASFLEKALIATLCIGVVYLLTTTDTSALALVELMGGSHGKD